MGIENRTGNYSQEEASKYNGKRMDAFKGMGVPEGWVVDGSLGEKEETAWVWDEIEARCWPLRPGNKGFLGGGKAAERAEKELEEARKKYGNDIQRFFVVSKEGYIDSFVMLNDLSKKPKDLMDEATLALEQHNEELSKMKATASILVTEQNKKFN